MSIDCTEQNTEVLQLNAYLCILFIVALKYNKKKIVTKRQKLIENRSSNT